MSFYDEIAKGINYEIGRNPESYLKVINGSLQLPHPQWLQYHLPYLDKVIESIDAFRNGVLTGVSFDVSTIQKIVVTEPILALEVLRSIENDKNKREIAIDIESRNLSTDKLKNKLLCIGIAYDEHEGVSFTRSCFDNAEFRKAFEHFLANEEKVFILHNGVYDRSRAKIIENLEIRIDEDTLLQHYCGINEHKGTHGLKELAQLYLGFPEWEKPLDDFRKQYCRANKIKNKDFQYDYIPIELLANYNVIDCCATLQLHHVFNKLMRPSARNIYRKLVEASPCYADMIARGMQLDLDYWKQLKAELEGERDKLEHDLARLIPGVLVTSPVQLKRWLETKFPFDNIESTDEATIEELYERHPEELALKTILDYRKNAKYLKTYVDSLMEKADSAGLVHCEFNLFGTETGRLCSKNPNIQNLPRNSKIKNLFVARPGYILLQLDYSQAELRMLAHISGDEILTQCYVNGGDLHSEMAKKIFGDKYDPHNKDQRCIAKTINFGIPYGRTAGGVAKQLNVSKAEAQEYLDKWFEGAPKVKDYIQLCHDMVNAEPQQLYYTVFGRTRHYFFTNETVKHAENQSVNFPISSTANDMTIYSFVDICNWLKERKLDAYPVNTVHDSLVFEVREKDVKEIADYCQFVMADVPKRYLKDLKVPFRADVEIGHSYGDMSEPEWPEEDEENEND